jgi:hypothetical protein
MTKKEAIALNNLWTKVDTWYGNREEANSGIFGSDVEKHEMDEFMQDYLYKAGLVNEMGETKPNLTAGQIRKKDWIEYQVYQRMRSHDAQSKDANFFDFLDTEIEDSD